MKFQSYQQAVRWLESIGGRVDGPRRKTDGYDAVTVFIPGHRLERTGLIDRALTAADRERAVKEAIRDACDELRAAGAERLVRG